MYEKTRKNSFETQLLKHVTLKKERKITCVNSGGIKFFYILLRQIGA